MPTSTRAGRIFVFTKRCGKFVIAQRVDRGVRPYKTFYVFAENAYNFAIAHCRVDVGIDPYGDFTLSPFVVRICGRIPRGQGRTPPLQEKYKYVRSSHFLEELL